MIKIPRTCPRGRDDCIALANLISDDKTTFNCCGENNGKNLEVETDIYRICCKTEFIDTMSAEFKDLGVWMDWKNPYLTAWTA